MKTMILTNLTLIDGNGGLPVADSFVVIERNKIKEVGVGVYEGISPEMESIDCKGQYLLPGLIDAHVHLGSTEASIVGQHRNNFPSYSLLKSLKSVKRSLYQGFTMVRDCGGADAGVRQALEEGIVEGPRASVSGKIISQTGGHGDFRLPTEPHLLVPYLCGVGAVVCDGVTEIRRAVREELRQGVDFIKVMAGGGCASASDAITNSQYSLEELEAMVFEAESAGTYVAAHCYADRSIINCVKSGVRTIEHGNLMTEEGAKVMLDAGAYLVPTIVTYETMFRLSGEMNLPEFTVVKNKMALEKAYEAIAFAKDLGVKIGSGSDLLGPMQVHQNKTIGLQARVLGNMGAIVATTKTNAEILRVDDQLGTIEKGKLADMILVNGNPVDDISIIEDAANNLSMIMKDGQIFKNII